MPVVTERQYTVRWYLRAGHREAGTITAHTLWVNTTDIALRTPRPYNLQELVELEICIDLATYVRCVVCVAAAESGSPGAFAYRCRFMQMTAQDRAILHGTLLAIRRREMAEDLKPMPWSRTNRAA